MRIFALLSWWDENPDHLRRAVRSLKGFADCLVAVDGAYRTFPGGGSLSPASNWAAISSAADDAGLQFSPHRLYNIMPTWDEVAKRAAMFDFGRGFGATPDDWFLIIDADMAVASGECRRYARDKLATTDLDVAEVRWRDVQVDDVPYSDYKFRSIFRALPGLTVERTHFLYTVPVGRCSKCWDRSLGFEVACSFADCDECYGVGRRFLWHTPDGHISPEPALDLSDAVTLHHYASRRNPERKQRALKYYADRDARTLESAGDWR